MVKNDSQSIDKRSDKGSVVEERVTLPPGKARFTRKLPEEENETKNLRTSELRTEADFCQQLLVDGYVQSYVDFYHLTHRADPHAPEGRPNVKIETTTEDMVFIRDNLVKAEVSRRQGNTTGVYVSYNNLAEFYKKNTDWRTAIYFHEKCLEVSQLTSDLRAEMNANHALGTVYQKMGDWDRAKTFHERHQEIAYSVDILEEVAKANIELHRTYLVIAHRLEDEGHIDAALEYFMKCVDAAVKCWDKAAEGEANGKIGNLLLRLGQASASLPYLRNHSQIAAGLGDAEGRCRACSSLAWALDSLGDDNGALVELTLVHSISEQAGDAYLQAHANQALGSLYSKIGKLEEAVRAFERHFDLLKVIASKKLYVDRLASTSLNRPRATNSDVVDKSKKAVENAHGAGGLKPSDLDLARVYVGISKGNLALGSYVHTIQTDLSILLDWKLSRTALAEVVDGGNPFEQKAESLETL